jgi:phosphoribosylformylglycinamidine synthase I
MSPKALVIRTAGTNCDKESVYAFEHAGAKVDLRHINFLKKHKSLADYNIICFPGGFSYGDNLGAGKIMALELNLWLKDAIKDFADKGGLAIGICNGFQIMVKTGLLPDVDFQQKVTLTDNDCGRFEARWVHLKPEGGSVWLKGLPQVITLPVAHGEGKFYAERAVLDKIEKSGCVALRYVDSNGKSGGYPINPNGALNDIAGITDKSGKIFGLMPHPERFMFEKQWLHWSTNTLPPYGAVIFKNAVDYFK